MTLMEEEMNIHTNKENTFVCQHKQVEFIVYVFCNNEELLVNSTVYASHFYIKQIRSHVLDKHFVAV